MHLASTGAVLNDGAWHHVVASVYPAGSYGNGIVNLYVDGVNVEFEANPHEGVLGDGSNPTTIGASPDGSGHYTGLIDSVGIWQYPLQMSDTTQLYNRGIGLEPSV